VVCIEEEGRRKGAKKEEEEEHKLIQYWNSSPSLQKP
jgi:hypothetical protein